MQNAVKEYNYVPNINYLEEHGSFHIFGGHLGRHLEFLGPHHYF
jgi:hypothetical protein